MKAITQRIRSIRTVGTIKDIWESVSGTEQDYTKGKLGRAMLLISIPMVLEMIMESIFALADIYFVSKLGAAATATVGITESIMTLIYAMAIGMSAATTAVISRRIGEKKPEKASEAAFQAILLTLIISLAIAIPGVMFTEKILRAMNASDEIIQNGLAYPRIMLGGNIVIMLLFTINAIFRSAGNAAISFRVLAIANILNIILDPCLIFGLGPFPELGIKGAAIATNIGRGVAVVYQLYLLFNGNLRVWLRRVSLRLNFKVMGDIFRLSLGGIGQHLIATSSWIILIRILAGYGDTVVAGYTVAIRLILFALLPCWGLSNAASTLVGQNLGAKKPNRAERSIWMSINVNIIFLATVTLFMALFPRQIVQLIATDPDIVNEAARALRMISYGFVLYGTGMVFMQSLNGSGDTKTPTLFNFVCYWAIEVPAAILLSNHFNLGPDGVYISIILAEALVCIFGYHVIRKGKWKENVV
jgi:putative MATE family efflux protein